MAAHLWGRKLSLEVNELARLLHGCVTVTLEDKDLDVLMNVK